MFSSREYIVRIDRRVYEEFNTVVKTVKMQYEFDTLPSLLTDTVMAAMKFQLEYILDSFFYCNGSEFMESVDFNDVYEAVSENIIYEDETLLSIYDTALSNPFRGRGWRMIRDGMLAIGDCGDNSYEIGFALVQVAIDMLPSIVDYMPLATTLLNTFSPLQREELIGCYVQFTGSDNIMVTIEVEDHEKNLAEINSRRRRRRCRA